jgi:predicted transcriptional regulator
VIKHLTVAKKLDELKNQSIPQKEAPKSAIRNSTVAVLSSSPAKKIIEEISSYI